MTVELDLDAIEARAAAATPGPWFWRGNTDRDSDVYLAATGECGVREVLGTVPVERRISEREIEAVMDGLCYTRGQARAYLRRVWAHDPVRKDVRTDFRLCVLDRLSFLRPVRELAVYEVARAQGLPDDTPRDHPRVYRADVVDVRHPDARFTAHARADVDALIAEVKRLRALLDDPNYCPSCGAHADDVEHRQGCAA